MYSVALKNNEKIFSVAPMMDWTDRHCRYFHRQLTHNALLYTEMVTADAVIHGNRERLLGFNHAEHPVAMQLGGSVPEKLAEAAKICTDFGYDEINLNVGCPSDRVKSGSFGACLMAEPTLVGDCIGAMKAVVDVPVTVKCRIGIDEQDEERALDDLADAVLTGGADAIWVHARKAWLKGLSPKENRDVPPLNYDRVYRLKARLGDVFVGINGGFSTLEACGDALQHMDGVMVGRAAYHNASMLRDVDRVIYGDKSPPVEWDAVLDAMIVYCEEQVAKGSRLSAVTRHMIGLFHGVAGARRYRQILSEEAPRAGASPAILADAFAAVA